MQGLCWNEHKNLKGILTQPSFKIGGISSLFAHLKKFPYLCNKKPSTEIIMKATVSMEFLWQTIQSLSLKNKEWLSSKLVKDIQEEKKTEYISKQEVLEGIRQGLKDVQESRANGKKLKTLQEVIDEL